MLRYLFSLVATAAIATNVAAQQSIEYDVSFANAAQHEAHVIATFRGVPRGTRLEARMARSSPGRYSPTGFAKNVYDVRAEDGRGRPLKVTRPHPHGWDVAGHDGTVKLHYTVWGDRTDGTYLSVDHSHAHMNIPATFMFVEGMKDAPIRLRIHPRAGWRVATQLPPTADSTVFSAPNMQYFMDSPTEVGPVMFSTFQHVQNGRPSTIRLAVHHLGTQAQVDSLAFLTKAVVAEQMAVFGEAPRFDYGTYTFIADYLPWASGDGMEHRNSTIVSSTRSIDTHANRMALLGTISHEFFHAWNMERLRSKMLEPFDFQRDNMSDELWFGEGFTNYYGPLTIRRAGLMTDQEYVRDLSGSLRYVLESPGVRHGSAVSMSQLAPFFDGATWRDPTAVANTFMTYYVWGEIIGVALDLTLRSRYSLTLDDYMRHVWNEFGKHQTASLTPSRPYDMAGLRRALGTLTKDTAFANSFFRRYIEGGEFADYPALLAHAGILMTVDSTAPSLGASLADDTTAVWVNHTSEGGSMYLAGIANSDRIFAVDGVPVTSADSLQAIIGRHKPGEIVQLDVMQKTVRRTVPMKLVTSRTNKITTYEEAGREVTPQMRRFREAWLGSKAPNQER